VDTLTLADVIIAILSSRTSFPLATSVALIRERDRAGVLVHLVLLDPRREPVPVAPGSVSAVTYAARALDPDLLSTFGNEDVIVLK
jgi:hypothetical protein